MNFSSQRAIQIFWNILKVLHLYRYYIILNTLVKVPLYYALQLRGKAEVQGVVIDHNFIQDIHALQRGASGTDINLIRIPYQTLYVVATLFFSEEIRDGSYVANNMQGPRLRYNRLLRKLLDLWGVEKRCAFFLAPSDSFFWIRELIQILREKGIPCIVIDKEGTISPHSMEHHSGEVLEKFPFMSDFIIVWSDRQKTFWQKTGVSADRIIVQGLPRSDFFFDRDVWLPREKLPFNPRNCLVLFFTFETDAYAPTPGDHIWRELRDDIDESLVALARRHRNAAFVVKTHPQQQDRHTVERKFNSSGLNNISVCHGADLSRHLIVHADLIIGFQTTALIEAMLAGKRVVYTQWSKHVLENTDNLIPFHEARGIDTCATKEHFVHLVDSIISSGDFSISPELMRARQPFVDIFIPNADGTVAHRVMRQVREIVTRRRHS